jgi:hypothetical protein
MLYEPRVVEAALAPLTAPPLISQTAKSSVCDEFSRAITVPVKPKTESLGKTT